MYLPSVTIVVSTHNRQSSLDRLALAIDRLNYPLNLVEVVIVDDGSVPPARLANHDFRFRLLRQEQQGPASARNAGIRAASGEFIAITDDDCAPHPDWLTRLCEVHSRSPDALVGGGVVNTLKNNLCAVASQKLIDYLYVAFQEDRSGNQFFTTSNVGGARAQFLKIGGFDESFPLPAGEDRDLSDRWKTVGPLIFAPDAIVGHFHSMRLAGFVRQHFRYGRGACVLHQKRAKKGISNNVEGLFFYRNLFLFPFRSGFSIRALLVAMLFLTAQIANIAGYAYEASGRSV